METLDPLFEFVMKNSKKVSEDFFHELFKRCPEIQFKFDRLNREDMLIKAIETIREGDKKKMLEIGKLHIDIKGLNRRDFGYFSTCLFNTLIDNCHQLLTKEAIRDLNTSIDKAVYCIQEGFLIAKELKKK